MATRKQSWVGGIGLWIGLITTGLVLAQEAVPPPVAPPGALAPTETPPPLAKSDAGVPQPTVPPPAVTPESGENPYQAISRRNPFGLLPPPPPPDPDQAPPPPPPPNVNLRLSGFTDLMGRRRAFIVITEQGPNKQPKTKALHEGERESGVEVLQIDFKARSVKVNNNGQVTNLTFAKMEASAGPPPAGIPGMPIPGQPGQPPIHRVIPNFPGNQGTPPPGGNTGAPANPQNASYDNGGGSVILGGNGVSDGGYSKSSKGGVFVSGGSSPVVSTGGNSRNAIANSGSPAYSSVNPTYSGTPGVTTAPPRNPRTRTHPYEIPIPHPLPDPSGGRNQ